MFSFVGHKAPLDGVAATWSAGDYPDVLAHEAAHPGTIPALYLLTRYHAIHYTSAMSNSPFFDNWTTQLRKGLLEFSILNALRTERRYGYDIVRILRNVDGLVIGEGTIYPLLNRLKQEGFVRATLQESPEGPARKYYQLTEFGTRQLREMNVYWKKMQSGIAELAKESDK